MRIEIRPPANVDWDALQREVQAALDNTLHASAQIVANEAKRRVARGPKTGRVYTTRFARNRTTGGLFPTEPRVPHQASAPGEAPATDTGKLVSSIVGDAEKGRGYVEARSRYAIWLEYGTRYMAARPFLFPSFEASRQRIADLIRLAVARGVNRFAEKRGR